MNILLISDYLPYPPDIGSNIRVFNLLKRMSRYHNVTLLSFVDNDREARWVGELKKYCPQIVTVPRPRRSKWAKLSILVRCLLTKEPMESRLGYDKAMADKIRQLMTSSAFHIVQIEHTYMGSYISLITNQQAKKIISIHNIGSLQYQRMFKIEKRLPSRIRWFVNWTMMGDWEIKTLKRFDKCLVVSNLDMRYLHSVCPELRISVIENGVDVVQYAPLPKNSEKKDLLFLGGLGYEPNSDAVLHFCSRILPLIRKEIPQCRFFIVGKNPSQDLRNLADGESVSVTGYVDDPVPYYQRCDILVVPLRAGGGSRLKILESMALGRPVVSTSIGCEGLEVRNDQHLLIADPPQEFARQCVRLLTDNSLYDRMALQGRELVEQKYSWDRISDNLQEVYSRLEEKT